MYPIIVLILAALLAFYADSAKQDFVELSASYRQSLIQENVQTIEHALNEYLQEHATYTENIEQLLNAQGYEYIKGHTDKVSYSLTTGIQEDEIVFDRAIVYIAPSQESDSTKFLEEGGCREGNHAISTSWCAKEKWIWIRLESKDRHATKITRYGDRMHRLANKFREYSSKTGGFPNKTQSGEVLNTGASIHVTQLVGYTGSINGCAENFLYQGIPIDCSDIFDEWGGLVKYKYISPTQITLSSESRFLGRDSEEITVLN